MTRKYSIKYYDQSDTEIDNIDIDLLTNDINFSSQVNGGQGVLNLTLKLPVTNSDFQQGQIVRVEEINDENPSGVLIYTGVIEEIEKEFTTEETINLRVIGLSSLLTKFLFNESSYTQSKTDYPGAIVKDIIDDFQTHYGTLISYGTDVSDGPNIINYDFNYTTGFKGVNDMVNLVENFVWYVDETGNISFKQLSSTALHEFAVKKDVFSMNIEDDASEVVNQLVLTHKTTTTVYSDATSISTYGLREKRISDLSLANQTAANDFGAKYIADNKDPKQKIVLQINKDYFFDSLLLVNDLTGTVNSYTQTINDLFDIKTIDKVNPGETCSVTNIDQSIFRNEVMRIDKVRYTPDFITLDLQGFDNFTKLIKE